MSESAGNTSKLVAPAPADTPARQDVTAPSRGPRKLPPSPPPNGTAPQPPARDVAATLGVRGKGHRDASWKRRLLGWGIAVLAVAAATVYVMRHRTAAPIHYLTQLARRGDLTVTVTATGTLAARDTVDVGTEVSGVIDLVAADYNDHVRKGEVLAVVNTDQLRAQIAQAVAALEAARATAQQTAATVAESQGQAIRAESLFARQMISPQDVESARASLARALAADANARAGIDASSAALQAQRTLLRKATIRSPIDGIVLQRQVEPGRTVAASFQTPVLFVLASDLARMTLALDVDEADVGEVRAGQAADFTVDAYPNRTFAARVRSVRNAAKTVEGVVTYQAILDVTNVGLALRPGMTATAVIKSRQVRDALLVANAALRFIPETQASSATTSGPPAAPGAGNRRQVWTLRQGIPVAIPLTTGVGDGQWTEVTSGAIQPGLALITGIGAASTTPATAADTTPTRRSTGPLPIPHAH